VLAFACEPAYPRSKSPTFAQEWGDSVAQCITLDWSYVELPAIDAAVAAGAISWDPAQAVACLAAPGIPAGCADLFAEDYTYAPACWQALAGHVPDGGACTTTWACAGAASNCVNGACAP